MGTVCEMIRKCQWLPGVLSLRIWCQCRQIPGSLTFTTPGSLCSLWPFVGAGNEPRPWMSRVVLVQTPDFAIGRCRWATVSLKIIIFTWVERQEIQLEQFEFCFVILDMIFVGIWKEIIRDTHMCDIHTHDMKEVTVNNEITMNDIPYWTCLMHRMSYIIHDLDTQSWNRLRQHVSSPSLQTVPETQVWMLWTGQPGVVLWRRHGVLGVQQKQQYLLCKFELVEIQCLHTKNNLEMNKGISITCKLSLYASKFGHYLATRSAIRRYL